MKANVPGSALLNPMGAPSYDVVEIGNAVSAVTSCARAIDVGAGSGRNSVFLRSLGFDVVAIESNPSHVRQALRIQKDLGLTYQILEQHIERAPLSGAFHLCLLLGLLHFLPRETAQATVQELKQRTVSGGAHLVTVSYNDSQGKYRNSLPDQGHLNSVTSADILEWYNDWLPVCVERYVKTDSHLENSTEVHPIAKFVMVKANRPQDVIFTTTPVDLTPHRHQAAVDAHLSGYSFFSTSLASLRRQLGSEDLYFKHDFDSPQLSLLAPSQQSQSTSVAFWGLSKCYFENEMLVGRASYASTTYHKHSARSTRM